MNQLFILGFGAISFLLLPWAMSNAKTDGDGLSMKESVLLVLGFVIVMALSLVPKSVLEKLDKKEEADRE